LVCDAMGANICAVPAQADCVGGFGLQALTS
jgi:hypothetical protein